MIVAAVIIARGGSKRLRNKNILPLAGKPLIAHAIAAARGAKLLARTIVSTDDAEIARIAHTYGAEVPFVRPKALATDQTPAAAVLAHAADWLDLNGTRADAIVLLQTSTLRRCEHIDGAIELFHKTGADTVTAVSPAPAHPYWCWKPDGAEIRPFFSATHIGMPRDELPPALIENGAVYVVRRTVLATGSLYGSRVAGHLLDAADAIDIDTAADLEFAEFMLARRQIR